MSGYLYLSFQRPPPAEVNVEAALVCTGSRAAKQTINISPLLTNDLRDEAFVPESLAGAPRLHFAWVTLNQEAGREWQVKALGSVCSTAWLGPESAWKTVSIALPELERYDGDIWVRLALWASTASKEVLSAENLTQVVQDALRVPIEVHTSANGQPRIIPVLSGPILLRKASIQAVQIHKHASQKGAWTSTQQLASTAKENVKTKLDTLTRLFSLCLPYEDSAWMCKPSAVSTSASKVEPSASTIMITERTGYELDKHLWDASLHLSRLLRHVMNQRDIDSPKATEPLRDGRRKWQRVDKETDTSASDKITPPGQLGALKHLRTLLQRTSLRVVELGAGTGLLSIALAVLLIARDRGALDKARLDARPQPPLENRADIETPGTPQKLHMYATDLSSALELIQSNIDDNRTLLQAQQSFTPESLLIEPLMLDWDEQLPSLLRDDQPDLVLVSDCTYNPESFPSLCRTIRDLLTRPSAPRGNGPHAPVCLLSKKHRHAAEEALWAAMQSNHLSWTLLSGANGFGQGFNASFDPLSTSDIAIVATDTASDDKEYAGWGIWLVRIASP
ncbi:S-ADENOSYLMETHIONINE-DEPENDENT METHYLTRANSFERASE DOMAIN-CONTAINING PROTEIN [Ceraceosorus bombacis]|uniref:S-ADENOSYLMETHIONINE-DEPENDENT METHYLTRANSFERASE DOMAIN-CONTAINING PROTEIN n=1 Tax=Ceraceosorus bombacis TaxID=401625 RepID=A0A0P1BF25_9BASI|nr:S-ADENOSYLMETHIONINE-DEPENDENT METHYLTRANSFERASE DOMAIN-CONTAINING PROTEIN [Ceraceosorus bombacis]